MLPFMKESDGGVLPTPRPQPQANGSGNMDGPQEFLTVADKGRNVRNSTMLVAVLFGLGLLGVWFMVQKTKPSAAGAAELSPAEAQIEGAISRLTGVSAEMMTRMDAIVKKFYEFSEVYQVQVDELSKNPFTLETSNTDMAPSEAEKTESEGEDTRSGLLKQLAEERKALALVSIMEMDHSNRCMIGDDILAQGDTVGAFTVVSISTMAVELEWIPVGVDLSQMKAEDTRIILKLSE